MNIDQNTGVQSLSEAGTFSFISIISSFSFMSLLYSLVFILVPQTTLSLILFNALNILFALISASYDYTMRKKKDFSTNFFESGIRISLILLVLGWLFSSLIDIGNFPRSFLPNPLNVGTALIILLSNLIAASIRNPLYERKEIHHIIVEAQSKKDSDYFSLHANTLIASYKKIKQLKSLSLVLLIFSIILGGVLTYSIKFEWFVGLWFLVSLLSSLMLLVISNTFLEEHRFYNFGIASPYKLQEKRNQYSLIIILACFVLSLVSSNNWSLFGPEVIVNFINWLLQALSSGRQDVQSLPQVQSYLGEVYSSRNATPFTGAYADSGSSNILSLIFTIIQYILLILLFLLILRFILKPLLQKKYNFFDTLGQILKELAHFILSPLRSMFGFFSNFKKFNKEIRKKLHYDTVIDPKKYILNLNKDPSQRLRLNNIKLQSLKIYLEYLEWAYKNGLRWNYSDSPQDISIKSQKLFSDETLFELKNSYNKNTTFQTRVSLQDYCSTYFKQIHSLLEKDLYSNKPLISKDLNELSNLIAQVKTNINAI